jgi:hypothetical protein
MSRRAPPINHKLAHDMMGKFMGIRGTYPYPPLGRRRLAGDLVAQYVEVVTVIKCVRHPSKPALHSVQVSSWASDRAARCAASPAPHLEQTDRARRISRSATAFVPVTARSNTASADWIRRSASSSLRKSMVLSSMILSRSRTITRRVTAVSSHSKMALSSPCSRAGSSITSDCRALAKVGFGGRWIAEPRRLEIYISGRADNRGTLPLPA